MPSPSKIKSQTTNSRTFRSVSDIVCALSEQLRPPERLSVSEASVKYRYVNNPGSYVGKWQNKTAPYLVEVMDSFSSPNYYGLVFAAPAQCGKTDALCINTIVHSVMVDGLDLTLYSPTNTDARDFSVRRIDRLNRHSEKIGERLLKGSNSDNKFDKTYSNGVLLTLGWPTAGQFAGRPIPRVVLTDYDRMPEDVDGEGSPYDLAAKRTTTFGSFAMAAAESSPSRAVTNPRWVRTSPHMAPPTTGILALYNRGDRRQWYWPCPHCEDYFVGSFQQIKWDSSLDTFADQASTAHMVCPCCQEKIGWDDRFGMLQKGTWLADGQSIERGGRVYGRPMRTGIASFWLNGVAAAFMTWERLVVNYLNAENEYKNTNSEEALKKFYNTDLAQPYYPKAQESIRQPEIIKSREEPLEQQSVPPGVRFMMATIDVQKNMFVVQVHGVIPGTKKADFVVIDRFDIMYSERLNDDGERLWVKPHSYPEDWDLITQRVLMKSYPLADGSGRKMAIKMTCCDSGGRAGATTNAYEFYRRLKRQGLDSRFVLLKGASQPSAPRVRIDYPDSNRKDRHAGARGDVPVMFLNPNMLKDELDGRLDVLDPGQGLIRFPDWLPDSFYAELCVEVRVDGVWKNPNKYRNESWDLLYYAIGLFVSPYIRGDKLNWDNPQSWFAQWSNNSLVTEGDVMHDIVKPQRDRFDLAQLAQQLA